VIPRKLKTVFFVSFGVWLVLLGLWTYKSYQPQPSQVAADPAQPKILLQDSEDWMSIYFNNQKIGYAHTIKQRSVEGYVINQDLFLRLMVLGFPRQVTLSFISSLTPEFLLKNFEYKMISGYLVYSIKGTVEGPNLKLTSDLMGEPQIQNIKLKGRPSFP